LGGVLLERLLAAIFRSFVSRRLIYLTLLELEGIVVLLLHVDCVHAVSSPQTKHTFLSILPHPAFA
jgi:hypothetical protein